MTQLRFLKTALLLSTVLSALPVQAGEGLDSLNLTESDHFSTSHGARAVASAKSLDDMDRTMKEMGEAESVGYSYVTSYPAEADQIPPAKKQAMAFDLQAALQQKAVKIPVALNNDSDSLDSLSDWSGVFVPANVTTASGQLEPHSSLGNKEEADALYAKNVAAHDRKPSVLARRVGLAVIPHAKSTGIAFVDWIGVPAVKAALAQKVAEGTATHIIDATGSVVAYGVGALVGHAPAAAFYSAWWGFNHGISYMPLGSTAKELFVGQMIIKPCLSPTWSVTKAVAPKVISAVKTVVSSVCSWVGSCFRSEAVPALKLS